jgi:hypothetical protein
MASQHREGIVRRKPEVTLSGAVGCDEVDVVAGYKGHPVAVARTGGPAAEGAGKGRQAGGRWPRRSPPDFGMIQRGGAIVIRMRADVKQRTIGPLIKATVAPGAVVSTDEYAIDSRLPQ